MRWGRAWVEWEYEREKLLDAEMAEDFRRERLRELREESFRGLALRILVALACVFALLRLIAWVVVGR